ncbi:MAG: CPBP family intramembrane glutamic endopeptidase [bacterium]
MTKKKDLITLFLINIPVVILYYAVYRVPGVRPYANIAYFCLILITGGFLGREFLLKIEQQKVKESKYLFFGVISMIFLYQLMKFSSFIISRNKNLQGIIDLSLWQYFVRPWHEINILVSVSGVIIIVLAVEIFYRVYIQNTLNLYFKDNSAVFLASAISGARAVTLGPVSGLVDFSLAYIWGFVYKKSGLWAAVFVHMVWDVLFVYFPAG